MVVVIMSTKRYARAAGPAAGHGLTARRGLVARVARVCRLASGVSLSRAVSPGLSPDSRLLAGVSRWPMPFFT